MPVDRVVDTVSATGGRSRKPAVLLRLASHDSEDGSQKQVPGSRTPYKNDSHTVRAFEVLQSLRNDEVLCDITLETDDGSVVYGHKVVLASATPYFHAMFTANFKEKNTDHVKLSGIDSTVLKHLVDFIYTAQIVINEDNALVLFHAANLLQLQDVQDACSEFLQTQLHPKNCLGIKEFADMHGCMKLSSSSESYIQKNFAKVVEGDEFLSLSGEQVIELISSDLISVASEENVFESVISWVNHDAEWRNVVLPDLMEHVRLPLISEAYLLTRVKEEPLIQNSLTCKNYIIEALHFHLSKYNKQLGTMPKTICTKPRARFGKQIFFRYDTEERLFSN